MYAIVRTGGKQYRVEEGRSIVVERLPVEEGATVELSDVLLIADNGNVTVGTPAVEGARVLAQVVEHGKAEKVVVFKYKAKVRTRKKTGHRQPYTRLTVQQILRPGEEPRTEQRPKRRATARKRAETEEAPEAPAAEAEAPTAVEETPEAAPKRRTRRRTAEDAPAQAEASQEGTEQPAPRRRTSRRKKTEETDETE